MVKPCELCGDIGVVDCIIVCCKCKITREHPYCMKIMHPGNADDWVCEECESVDWVPSSKPSVSFACSLPDPSKQPSNTTIIKSNLRKPPQNTKVQYITPEEARVLESGTQRKNFSSPTKSSLLFRPTVNRTPPHKSESIRCTIPPPKFCAKSSPRDNSVPPGFTKLQSTTSFPNTLQDKKLPGSKGTEKHVIEEQYDRQDSPSAIRLPAKKAQTSNTETEKRNKGPPRQMWQKSPAAMLSVSGKISKTNIGRENMNPGHTSPQLAQGLSAARSDKGPTPQLYCDTSAGMSSYLEKVPKSDPKMVMGNSENTSVEPVHHLAAESSENSGSEGKESVGFVLKLDRYLLNHPAEFPTWKGSFNITNDVILRSPSQIQAHPPCKVHRKVYDLSKKLPEVLQIELLPRVNIWESLFKADVPCALDIGLYFLSSESASLVEFLDEHDMLLRGQVNGVELLVFSSKHLQKDSQRINQEFFLWGLFRSFEDNTLASGSESGDDMDIDMSGGYEMGNIDKVIPKPPINPCADPTVSDFTPLKKVCLGGMDPVLPSTTSSLSNESDFLQELQNSLDQFVRKFGQPQEVEAKEEPLW